MRKLIISLLAIFIIAGMSNARTLLIYLTGDSPGYNPELVNPPPSGTDEYGQEWQCLESSHPAPVLEWFPGDHNWNGAWAMQEALQPDHAYYCLGCNDPGYEPVDPSLSLHGWKGRGDRAGFEYALGRIVFQLVEPGIPSFRKDVTDDGHEHEDYDIEPRYCFRSRKTKLGLSDTLHLVIQGTGGHFNWGGFIVPGFFFALPDSNCHEIGGVPLLPYFESETTPGLWQYISEIQGEGHVMVYLAFAYAAEWLYWMPSLDRVNIWAATEDYIYIADDFPRQENVMYWPGLAVEDFYIIEPLLYVACAYQGYFSDGFWAPHSYDLNADYQIALTEALEAVNGLNSQGTGTWECDYDFWLWKDYPDVPDEDPPPPGAPEIDIWPNPFNPVTQISLNLPSAMPVKIAVFNVLGQQVVMLCNSRLQAGAHRFSFNGSPYTSGIYFLHSQFDQQVQTQKMSLVK